MVIVELNGGLGNQMFQYAAARRLAWKRGAVLKLDVSKFATGNPRAYGMGAFEIQEQFAAAGEIRRLKVRRPLGRFLARVSRRVPREPVSYVREKRFRFDPAVLALPAGVYLEGYWQSERYFADAAPVIRQELRIKTPLEGVNRALADEIMACNAVSVHVRRGDYVADPVANRVLGPCTTGYYQAGAAFLLQRAPHARFYIFSDEPDWVRDNVKLPGPAVVVAHNGAGAAHEDLRLMSLCRHHLIANSSFSWWGAWLCSHAEKIVIAPRQWFRSPEWDATDLVPDTWIRM